MAKFIASVRRMADVPSCLLDSLLLR